MNELEKNAGRFIPYIASDPELANTRTHAKLVCHQFNLADPTTPYERVKILGALLKFKGKAYLEPMFYCGFGFNIELGDNCVIGAGSVVTKDIPANSVAVVIPAK